MKNSRDTNERLANNMAYINSQIDKLSQEIEKKKQELKNKINPHDVNGNELLEIIPGEFSLSCSEIEFQNMVKDIQRDMCNMNEYIDELEDVASSFPKDTSYTDKETEDFVLRVSKLNGGKYNSRKSRKNTRTKNEDLPRRIVDKARTYIGVPYVLGGYSPKGLDCSGLVCYSAKECGYDIGRQTTRTLINMGTEVKREDLQIGDLIFPKSSHVGFYSGNNKFLHSPKPGKSVEEINIYAFWRARRIFPGKGGDSTSTPSGGGSGSGSSGMYNSDSYYGPGSALELVERTPDPEVSKVVVPQGATSWATMASYLGVSQNTLQSLNPGISTLYAGTTLYIPTSAVTQARQLSAKAKNNLSRTSADIDETISLYGDNFMLMSDEDGAGGTSPYARASKEATPFDTFLKNENFIKAHDLKYHKHEQARMEINYSGKVRTIQTLISPTSFSEMYSNSINVNQTAGGWFVSRHGEALPQLTITGYMLDTTLAPEKHAFMNEFKNYMTDKVNKDTGDYENSAIIKIVMEGVEYQGHVTSIGFSKDASRPSLYSFNMNFTCLYYRNVRNVQEAVNALTQSKKSGSGKELYLADGIASIINGN